MSYKYLLAAMLAILGSASNSATLIHEYNFNDGTVTDNIGSINGSLYGDAYIAGGELILDGDGDFAQLTGYAVPTSGDFSVAIRVRQDSVQSGDHVEFISQGYSSAGNPGGFYIGHDPSRDMRFGDQHLSTPVEMQSDGAYHDYVLTTALGVGTKVYIDGVLAFSSAIHMDPVEGGTTTRFGDQFQHYTEFFHGALDDILIYEGALTLSEVQAYSSPNGEVPVPLPAALLLSGLAGFGLLRRKR